MDLGDVPEPPVFEIGEKVRVLAWTYPGFLPRLATGCGEAIVVAFNFDTREYTVKPLAMYSRLQTKIPEGAVVNPCRDGAAELYSRGGQQSSEATKIINDLSRQIAKLATGLEQAHVQLERERKRSKVAEVKVALGAQGRAVPNCRRSRGPARPPWPRPQSVRRGAAGPDPSAAPRLQGQGGGPAQHRQRHPRAGCGPPHGRAARGTRPVRRTQPQLVLRWPST